MTTNWQDDLRIGEKEITVHVDRSDRIAGGVSMEFRQVTQPNVAWSQRIHLTKEEAQQLHADLGEILSGVRP